MNLEYVPPETHLPVTNCLTQTPRNILPTNGCPDQIKWWIARKRSYDLLPSIPDIHQFGKAWLQWWAALQPPWRKPIGGSALPPAVYTSGDDNWGSLRVSGKNGVIILLISLVWWGRAGGSLTQDWKLAVSDLKRCLERMSGSASKRAIIQSGGDDTALDRKKLKSG